MLAMLGIRVPTVRRGLMYVDMPLKLLQSVLRVVAYRIQPRAMHVI
jgi:hypothetical protein